MKYMPFIVLGGLLSHQTMAEVSCHFFGASVKIERDDINSQPFLPRYQVVIESKLDDGRQLRGIAGANLQCISASKSSKIILRCQDPSSDRREAGPTDSISIDAVQYESIGAPSVLAWMDGSTLDVFESLFNRISIVSTKLRDLVQKGVLPEDKVRNSKTTSYLLWYFPQVTCTGTL